MFSLKQIEFHQIDITEKNFRFSERKIIAQLFQIEDDFIFSENPWANDREEIDLIPYSSNKQS